MSSFVLTGCSGDSEPFEKKRYTPDTQVDEINLNVRDREIEVKRASQLLIEITKKAAGGEIFIPCMSSLCIKDIARYMLTKHNLDESYITVTGIRPGEKINEELLSGDEEKYLYKFTNDLFVILREDIHGWFANGIIERAVGFSGKSDKSVLPYESAKEYLMEAGV